MTAFVVVGALSLDPEQQERWRALPLDASKLRWLEELPVLNGTLDGVPATVAEALDPHELHAAHGVSFVEATPEGGTVHVRAWLEAERAEPWLTGFVAALRSSGAAGGEGEVYVLPLGEGVAIQATCGKRSRLELVEPQAALERHGLAIVQLQQWVEHKERHPERTRAEFVALAARHFLHPLADAPPEQRALLEALRRHGAAALLEAAGRATVVGPDDRPLAATLGDARRLAASLETDDPALRVAGIYLDALLAPDPDELARLAQIEALAGLDAPGLDARLAATVGATPDLRADAYAVLADPAPTPADVAGCEAAFRRARHLVEASVARRVEAVVPTLLAAVPTALPPNVRQHLCGALLQLGGPAVERVAGRLQHAVFGMGLALNQDDARRRQLLRIEQEQDLGGIIHFEELDLGRFRTLVAERFLALDAQQNDAPPAGAFLELLEQHPEVRCHGYAVSAERDDYRVMIEGARCDLDAVEPGRRPAIREAFAALCADATQHEATDQVLYAWWT